MLSCSCWDMLCWLLIECLDYPQSLYLSNIYVVNISFTEFSVEINLTFKMSFTRRTKLYFMRMNVEVKLWMNLCHQVLGIEEEQERYEYTDSIDVNLNEHWNFSVSSSIYRDLVWTCFDFEVWWFFSCSFSVLQISEFWIWNLIFDFALFDLIRFWFCLLYNYGVMNFDLAIFS